MVAGRENQPYMPRAHRNSRFHGGRALKDVGHLGVDAHFRGATQHGLHLRLGTLDFGSYRH
eukprot:2825-Eustigmatos_ZCMA.PRE.1